MTTSASSSSGDFGSGTTCRSIFFDTDLIFSCSFAEKLLVLTIRIGPFGISGRSSGMILAKPCSGLRLATVAAPAAAVVIKLRREKREVSISINCVLPNLQQNEAGKINLAGTAAAS